MPEGDILVRVARRLDAALAGKRLLRGELRWPSLGAVDLAGTVVLGTATYGKHLLTRFDDGRTLHTHLRMDGLWRVYRTSDLAPNGPRRADRSPDVRAVLTEETWTCLGFLLGMMDLVPTAEEDRLLAHLGPDLLGADLDVPAAAARIRAEGARPIAEVLLDQRVVAGMGTIYVAETLWALRTWPWAPAEGVDAEAIARTGRDLMQRSVDARTPTATGDPRRPSHVHGRDRRPCHRCGTPIRTGRAGTPPNDRPVYWCPRCQRRPA